MRGLFSQGCVSVYICNEIHLKGAPHLPRIEAISATVVPEGLLSAVFNPSAEAQLVRNASNFARAANWSFSHLAAGGGWNTFPHTSSA